MPAYVRSPAAAGRWAKAKFRPPLSQHDFSMIYPQSGHARKEEIRDWCYANGLYSAWGKGRALITSAGALRRYEMDFTYKFFDR